MPLIALWVLFASSLGHAADSVAYQVCSLFSPASVTAAHSVTGSGEGCTWQWPNSEDLSAYVHFENQRETVAAMKEMMEASLQLPVFKKAAFPVCKDGEIVIGAFQDGKGPGGIGYTQCGRFVLTFSFQGTDPQSQLLGLTKRIADTRFVR